MSSEKRPIHDPAPAADGRVVAGFAPAGRRSFRSALPWRFLATAMVCVCLVLAGCSGIPGPRTAPRSAKRHTALTQPRARAQRKQPKEKKSLLTSWFKPKEPPPPQSPREWLELEPIRP